jgi:predicted ATPase
VAAELLGDFPDGACFVDLAPLNDPGLVLPTIARTLGLREGNNLSLNDVVSVYLATKRLLVVLDNYEHLLTAAPVVNDLLRAGPDTVVLVTSREPLHVRGEREVAVGPLALPDHHHHAPVDIVQNPAVALFVERAQAARRDFELTDENASLVAAICRQLDGLPLAIELAAARVKVLPPGALLASLKSRLPLLAGGPRDAPARQRALRDTIAWSYDLLRAEEQALFGRLAVFVGGFTLEAAEVMAAGAPDLGIDSFEGVASLMDKSLLRSVDGLSGEPRYTMLRPYGSMDWSGWRQAAREARFGADTRRTFCL